MFKERLKALVLILLVCVLVIGILPGQVSAAATVEMWEYNGVRLPAFPPQWDSDKYPFARIRLTNGFYYFEVLSAPPETVPQNITGVAINGMLNPGSWATCYTFEDNVGEWEYWEEVHNNDNSKKAISTFVWTNYNVMGLNGSVYMAASEPVKPQPPDVPYFIVNLPNRHVYAYELNEQPAQLYVSAAVTSSTQNLIYTWQKASGGMWVTVDSGNPNGQYYTPPTSVEGTNVYRCMVTNTLNGVTSTVYSNEVYVVVGSNMPEDSTISPGDQVIIDQIGQIGDDVGGIKEGIEQLPDEITDGIGEALETEKVEAGNTGQESVNELMEAVPDIGPEMVNAFSVLEPYISSTSTVAVLNIPEVRMPEIPGLVEGGILLGAQTLDFEGIIQLMPVAILFVVQCVLSIALAVFWFRDVYSVISYIFMGRSEKI